MVPCTLPLTPFAIRVASHAPPSLSPLLLPVVQSVALPYSGAGTARATAEGIHWLHVHQGRD